MKKILITALVSLLIFSCKKDDDNEIILETKGKLVITIKKENNPIGEGVKVFTNPKTKELTTDIFGQVVFEDLEYGEYTFYSYIEGYGSAKNIINLDQVFMEVDLELVDGVNIAPFAAISPLENGAGFALGETIQLTGTVMDVLEKEEDLKVIWESNMDGVLNESQADADGNITLQTNALSKNEHIISLTVTNSLEISTTTTIDINTLSPKKPILSVENALNEAKILRWQQEDENFKKIEIYRKTNDFSSGIQIAVIEDTTILSYEDTLVPFEDVISYYAIVYNNDGYQRISDTVITEGSRKFNIQARQAVFHPTKPWVYLRSQGNTITIINYETFETIAAKSFGGTIGEISVGNNGSGDELYIPNSDGWLYIHDAENFSLKESIGIGVSVESVITNNNGLLYVSSDDDRYPRKPIKVYNRSTLELIDSGGDYGDTILKLLPSGNEIIEITTTVGPTDLNHYLLDTDGNFIASTSDRYHGDYPLDGKIFEIAPVNNFFITSSKGAIYTADKNLEYVGLLPRLSESFSDFEFNDSASIIYAGISSNKKILTFDGSSFDKTGEIETKGYPLYLKRKNDKLIIIHSTTQFGTYINNVENIAIEVINLN